MHYLGHSYFVLCLYIMVSVREFWTETVAQNCKTSAAPLHVQIPRPAIRTDRMTLLTTLNELSRAIRTLTSTQTFFNSPARHIYQRDKIIF